MKLENSKETRIVMVGAGIMSTTLAALLVKINSNIKITMFERLDGMSRESSNGTNNAGTGHSGFCEMNYTPESPNGKIDISKAVQTAKSFEFSREFWAYFAESGFFQDPGEFITPVPHMAFVFNEADVNFLEKRRETMIQHPLFEDMNFTNDRGRLERWLPLMMKGRYKDQKVAATRMIHGTDVDYGTLTRKFLNSMVEDNQVDLFLSHEVRDLTRDGKTWRVKVKDLKNKKEKEVTADFVFVGAGGKAITLLQKSGIEEGKGYAGFPVGGQWLVSENKDLVKDHKAKVYGKAGVGAPPMSVPHLDNRVIEGTEQLLFGPFANFSTKFLKHGSAWDLPESIRLNNIWPMIGVGLHNFNLIQYLIKEVLKNKDRKISELRKFFPEVDGSKWHLSTAGQRVQIIKKDKKEGGVLQFGTEIVSSADGSLAALLGASPGASTAVKIMLDLIEKCFPENVEEWKKPIQSMIPSFKNPDVGGDYYKKSRERTGRLLELDVDSVRMKV